ncbi:MAG: heme lyase CcmF/NrfE family subunit [Burkholderiales bacterium]|nr:heme lyase CcmF/NrfE family subunit [Burkholderiales bacterium]
MIPELGHFALILALIASLVQGILPLTGAALGIKSWMNTARPAVFANALFSVFAFLCLLWCFYANDFSVLNVASNSNTMLPWYYRLSAAWGSHEGSILLWTVLLAVWGFLVAVFSRHLPQEVMARVISVMGLVSVGLVLFMLLTSDPFHRLFPAAAEGRDLNPLLQDPGMVFHPPLLYMGYVGMVVPYAFAVAALIGGRLDAAWARWTRPWTSVAWIFLTCGIALGSWWAYYELGWGGWWFWDPVENASFMPWLTATALLHSLAVTEKRGSFKIWTVLLALITFSLSLLGTFLVRSGVLTSVHAFATDPQRGLFILALLIIVIGGSLLLFAWRAPRVGTGGSFELFSRESMLLVNNVLLVVAMAAVLLGTLYPLFIDALNAGKISVGPPYFDSVFGPIMIPVVFLMAIGPLVRWKDAKILDVCRRTAWCFLAALICGMAVPLIKGWSAWVCIGMFLSFWVFFCFIESVRESTRNIQGKLIKKLRSLTRAYWGMMIAHLGVAVFIVGVAMVMAYSLERDVTMTPGNEVAVGDYTFKFINVDPGVRGPNYIADVGTFDVYKGSREVAVLHPEKRKYFSSEMPMTEASISSSITGDLYVSMGSQTAEGAWIVRAYDKPFVTWIWWGCLIMSIGALVAMFDKRYRLQRKKDLQKLGSQVAQRSIAK